MRNAGFAQPVKEDDPICRWQKGSTVVDVMPTYPEILGFGNRWYPNAIGTAVTADLGKGIAIRTVTPPLFLGTKLAAFEGRGKADFYASQDIEDIMAVIDGRPELIDEVRACDAGLRSFVAERFRAFLSDKHFNNALPGLIYGFGSSPDRAPIVQERLAALAAIDSRP